MEKAKKEKRDHPPVDITINGKKSKPRNKKIMTQISRLGKSSCAID